MRSRDFIKPNRDIIVVAHNIRSIQNVGAILRTSECFGINKVIASGYTPNLTTRTDGSNLPLLPHVKEKLKRELHRSALGVEELIPFSYHTDINKLLMELKTNEYSIIGLEQNEQSISLPAYQPPTKVALLLGEEVHGLTTELLQRCDNLIEIPMFGVKESFNVSVATGIALYALSLNTTND